MKKEGKKIDFSKVRFFPGVDPVPIKCGFCGKTHLPFAPCKAREDHFRKIALKQKAAGIPSGFKFGTCLSGIQTSEIPEC